MPEFPDLADDVVASRARAPAHDWVTWLQDARDIASRRFVLVVALLAIAVGAGAFWYHAGTRSPSRPPTTIPVRSRAHSTTTRDRGAPTGSLLVHVSGAVVRPGLYHLAADARVADAIAIAGGATADADTDRINLAARVADGQHIVVPRVGQPAPADSGIAVDSTSSSPSGPISINTASASELESLPHIGPALARAIIDYRQQHGGFRSVHDLRNVHGIGERVYADIAPMVTL